LNRKVELTEKIIYYHHCTVEKKLKERKRLLPLSRFGYFPWFNPDEPAVVIDIHRLSLFTALYHSKKITVLIAMVKHLLPQS
jgi:hypothetical protein